AGCLITSINKSQEPVPQSCLDTTLDRVVEGVSHVLGNHPLGEDDSVVVNNIVELLSGFFDRLRSKEWLNYWDIAAALEMTNRPAFVHLGINILLHKKDANGKIINYIRKDMNDLERSQVFICPLNINANHFILLKINKQTKIIYYYDSMTTYGIIYRKTKSILVRRVIELIP
ncbi:hypothetical protein BKA65DRAFT_518923, partial [Rhexocercosporidium sp. MPI-PUGE-AT-0058]